MLIVNADDLGMTPGANQAIFDGFDNGAITHTSIMANADYFDEAMRGIALRPKLGLGMHLNLTYGKACISNPLYTDAHGYFNLSYTTLLTKRSKLFLDAIEKEWEAQIERVHHFSDKHVNLTHIDSHRHIHLIPHLYPIGIKLAQQYHIKRVRLIHEKLWESLWLTKRFDFILNGGIVKYFLLRLFSFIDKRYKNLYEDISFYSILYTGVIREDILSKLKRSPYTYEIMVHPSYPDLDTQVTFYDADEKRYRISSERTEELHAVLSVDKYSHDR